MKGSFYLFLLLLLTTLKLTAQDCSSLQFTWTVNESRCMATGSIVVNASGGSGSYNYKVTGPVSPAYTSSSTITGLSTGYYTISVKDINTNCVKEVDSVFVPGSYSDPRFQLKKTDVSCANNDGTISLDTINYGRSPFTFTIISPSPSQTGNANTTGSFTGLTPGEYYIQLTDSCGGIQVRRITISQYDWWFNGVPVSKIGCDSASATINLEDNQNNVNTSGNAFDGFSYGVTLTPGDTTWVTSYNFTFYLGHSRTATFVVKDKCGNMHTSVWTVPPSLIPTVSYALTPNDCTTFSVSINGSNLTNPTYCLTDSTGTEISCDPSGSFNFLTYGSYCIKVTDACYDTTIMQCFTARPPAPSVDSIVSSTYQNCTTFTATVTGQSHLTNPQYCIYDTSGNQISCNTTGTFTDLPLGSYCIKIHDGCIDTTLSRCFTVGSLIPQLTNYYIGNQTCTDFSVNVSGINLGGARYCLYDSLGNVLTCDSTGAFDSLPYGSYCVRAISPCGDTSASLCFGAGHLIPSVGGVVITNKACTDFTVSVTGQQNLINPTYYLFDKDSNLIATDTTGVFDHVPYGNYCIHIKDGCIDTTIFRCFNQTKAYPSVNATVLQSNSTCSSFTAQVKGNNLTSPQFCVYDSQNNQISCNTTGIFNNLPYGSYCFTVYDSCIDSSFRVCQTFVPLHAISVWSSKNCTIGVSDVTIQFESGSKPYNVKIYHPNGKQVLDSTYSFNPLHIQLSALPAGTAYRIIGTDACGTTDSATLSPIATQVTRSTVVQPKCPSGMFMNGSGDIVASYTSNYYSILPAVIEKNGAPFSQGFSSNTGTSYTFSDLEPAQYVVQYAMQTCNTVLYDTVTVTPYTYPSQGHSALYQCDNNGFTLSADVSGGVSPYSFEIIGSQPDTPSIVAGPQSSALFTINNGTAYSLVRLRTIDACGNATLNDVSVLPLQNFNVSTTNTCFYNDITLSVDNVPNADYTWYKKTTPTDSTLLGTGSSYNLPFFEPDQVGQYLCVIDVNNSCLLREAAFNMDGSCYGVLATEPWKLEGTAAYEGNVLSWKVANDFLVSEYIIEKSAGGQEFSTIGILPAGKASSMAYTYHFTDNNPGMASNQYRIHVVYKSGSTKYSNTVSLRHDLQQVRVYPNPVKNEIHISIASDKASNYQVQLFYANGQKVFETAAQNITQTVVTYNRPVNLPGGIYLLRVTDKATGSVQNFKVIFE